MLLRKQFCKNSAAGSSLSLLSFSLRLFSTLHERNNCAVVGLIDIIDDFVGLQSLNQGDDLLIVLVTFVDSDYVDILLDRSRIGSFNCQSVGTGAGYDSGSFASRA